MLDKKETKKEKGIQDSIINKIGSKNVFSININGYERRDITNKSINNVLWADDETQIKVYQLFILLKNELGYISDMMGLLPDTFERTSRFLYSRFFWTIKEKKNLENAIKKKIDKLKQYRFLTSKGLGIRSGKLVNIDQFDIKDEYIELTIEDIDEIFLELRRRQISFYEAILEEYKNKKLEYDERLKIKKN